MNNKKFLEGCEPLKDGRYRIREKMTVIPIKCTEPITEKIMVEGKEISPKHKYTLMIWDDNANGNGRNYKYVIDRVIQENRPTFCLADHPADGCEADSARICGCGKNYRKRGNWLIADIYLFGNLGDTLAQGFDLGVPINCSSSVLGTLDDEGFVVNDSTFYLERICDILGVGEFPSNGIYHYNDHEDKIDDDYEFETISEQGFKESNEKKLTIFNNRVTENEVEDYIGDETMQGNTNDELIQQSMILNIKSMIKDAEKLDNPFDKKETLVSADSFAQKLTDKNLHNELCKKIEDIDNEIKELSTKGLQTDDLTTKVKSLEDESTAKDVEIENLKKVNSDLETKLKTLTDMYEDEQFKASETELEKSLDLEEKNHILSHKVFVLKSMNRKLESSIEKKTRVFEAKMKKIEADANTKVDAELLQKCNAKIKSLEDEVATLKSALNKSMNRLSNANDELVSLKQDTLQAKKVNDALDVGIGAEEIVALKEKNNELIAKNNRLRRALNEANLKVAKASRFSTLRKSLEDDKPSKVINNDIVDEEIDDDSIVINNDGVSVENRDEDDIMEKMLSGQIK